MSASPSLLFQPFTLRGVTSRNRIVISPMCQYSAVEGMWSDWHFANASKFASGGAGIFIAEASAVEPRGRITHGDIGIWSDAHAEAMRGSVAFVKSMGTVPGIQIAHAGRKASMQRPWHGNGPMDASDAARGEQPWEIVAPSAEPAGPGFLVPKALSGPEIGELSDAFAAAAHRANEVGYEFLEIHGAHGYLIHSFLSPLANFRDDEYGGSLDNRMRFALEVAQKVRAAWPHDKPLSFRIASVDAAEGGWTLDDSVVMAGRLKEIGVDVIDCSSGGIAAGSSPVARGLPRGPGFQVPFAARIRREVNIPTMAVGLITEAHQAEQILQDGDADLIAIAREALNNPYFAHHAAAQLGADPGFDAWPEQYGWWLTRRAKALAKAAES